MTSTSDQQQSSSKSTPVDEIVTGAAGPLMRQRISSSEFQYVLQVPVEVVLQAREARYPNHPAHPGILDATVIHEDTYEEKQQRTVSRLVKAAMNLPGWLRKFVGSTATWNTVETIEADLRKGTVTATLLNAGMYSLNKYREVVTMTRHPENPDHTLVHHEVSIGILLNLWGVTSRAEAFALSGYADHVAEEQASMVILVAEVMNGPSKDAADCLGIGEETAHHNSLGVTSPVTPHSPATVVA